MGIQEQGTARGRGGVVALIIVCLFIFFVVMVCLSSIMAMSDMTDTEEGIGVVEITGTIASADGTVKTIRDFNANKAVKAVLVRIDSPGGSVSASQEMVEAIKTIKKPVVISMGDMAASGGYYVACAGPKIFANPGTLTGSIGVISQVMEVKDLMEFFKVNVHTVKTGDLKDAGSPFRAFNEKDRDYFTKLGLEILDQFVSHVADARGKKADEIAALADGRVWSGRDAYKLGLVDALGGFNAALEALKEEAGISGNVALIYPKKNADTLIEEFLTQGVSSVSQQVREGVKSVISAPEAFEYRFVMP